VPHPPSGPPTARTPRTSRLPRADAFVNAAPDQSQATTGLSQSHSYANNTASQSPAADVNKTSAIGQKWRTEMESEGRQRSAKGKDLTTNASHCNVKGRSSIECDQRYSRSNSNTNSNTSSNMNSRRSSVTLRQSGSDHENISRPPAVQQQRSAARRDSATSVTNDDDAARQPQRRVNSVSKSSHRHSSGVAAGRDKRTVLTGKMFRDYYYYY